jgi:hypothetical protein
MSGVLRRHPGITRLPVRYEWASVGRLRLTAGAVSTRRLPQPRHLSGPRALAGRPFKEVRAVLRLDEGNGFDFSTVAQLSRSEDHEIRRFMADLVTGGWLRQDLRDHWVVTDRGREILVTSRERITRLRAEAVLTAFMERVREINKDRRCTFQVDVVVVFGSYLSDRPRIGDVDVAVRLRPRYRSKKERKEVEQAVTALAPHVPAILDHRIWPSRKVISTLKAKQTAVDVRGIGELELAFQRGVPFPYQVLLGHWQPPPAKVGR